LSLKSRDLPTSIPGDHIDTSLVRDSPQLSTLHSLDAAVGCVNGACGKRSKEKKRPEAAKLRR